MWHAGNSIGNAPKPCRISIEYCGPSDNLSAMCLNIHIGRYIDNIVVWHNRNSFWNSPKPRPRISIRGSLGDLSAICLNIHIGRYILKICIFYSNFGLTCWKQLWKFAQAPMNIVGPWGICQQSVWPYTLAVILKIFILYSCCGLACCKQLWKITQALSKIMDHCRIVQQYVWTYIVAVVLKLFILYSSFGLSLMLETSVEIHTDPSPGLE